MGDNAAVNDSATEEVTVWELEQTSPGDLTPPREGAAPGSPAGPGLLIVRAEVPSPEFSRFLYTAVGGDVTWTDRLGWDHARWRELLAQPGRETWVAWERGTPAGYAELCAPAQGVARIDYFGLLPAFRGRGIGGRLLSVATARAWELHERWPGREPVGRVVVETCSKDGPHALENYRRRGFRVHTTRTERAPRLSPPGPWPGAGSGAETTV